eukprot:TRINITY_DN63735_c0_g1_i1.p1 TRINITY_DN63735_c0_g1~~TRINITY_DN63735_c0_g1_i1.p1  ORF type:complete len:288 (+),score=13.11 TRINITY_DN63735_c0_g1_i1:315-1178(+)
MPKSSRVRQRFDYHSSIPVLRGTRGHPNDALTNTAADDLDNTTADLPLNPPLIIPSTVDHLTTDQDPHPPQDHTITSPPPLWLLCNNKYPYFNRLAYLFHPLLLPSHLSSPLHLQLHIQPYHRLTRLFRLQFVLDPLPRLVSLISLYLLTPSSHFSDSLSSPRTPHFLPSTHTPFDPRENLQFTHEPHHDRQPVSSYSSSSRHFAYPKVKDPDKFSGSDSSLYPLVEDSLYDLDAWTSSQHLSEAGCIRALSRYTHGAQSLVDALRTSHSSWSDIRNAFLTYYKLSD